FRSGPFWLTNPRSEIESDAGVVVAAIGIERGALQRLIDAAVAVGLDLAGGLVGAHHATAAGGEECAPAHAGGAACAGRHGAVHAGPDVEQVVRAERELELVGEAVAPLQVGDHDAGL